MSKTQVVMLLLLSIVFGLAAVLIAKQWIDGQNQPTVELEEIERHPVLVAAMELEPGTVLEEKHLTTKLMEVDWIEEDTLKVSEQALGRIVANTIYSGEMVNPNRLALPGEGATLAALIPENKRAITIRVNDVIGVAGFLLPGNKVDILNTISSGKGKSASTKTVLKNIKVLAVDQTAKTNDNKPVIVRAVTLEVTPKEAEKLLSENSKGKIQLALRNPHEVDKPPVARKYTPRPSVTIIKGSQASMLAEVVTASPLDDQRRAQVNELIGKVHEGGVELSEKVDPHLIGGFKLRVGDRMIDASVFQTLRSMHRNLTNNPYEPAY